LEVKSHDKISYRAVACWGSQCTSSLLCEHAESWDDMSYHF